MTQEHPITPPPELAEQWLNLWTGLPTPCPPCNEWLATQAARWGADQELEACCKLLELSDSNARDFLYSARRPKPPSLKEQALQELERTVTLLMPVTGPNKVERLAIIRRALESLPN